MHGTGDTVRDQDGIVHVVNGVSFDLKEGKHSIRQVKRMWQEFAMLSVLSLIPDSLGSYCGKALF